MPAAERRKCIVDAALPAFARSSYRGVTTAEIARAVGVSEPILYRHFPSKRDLYLACVDEAWERLRDLWREALEHEEDAGGRLAAMGRAYLEASGTRALLVELWVGALTEAGEDSVIRRFLRGHLRAVHGFVADVIRRAQAEGGMRSERDADAEAWIFLSLGLLATVGRRLGDLLEGDWSGIFASRRAWMTTGVRP
jgi:AcrR family transcriptional regulator